MDIEPKENSDLLKKKNTTETNGNLNREEQRGPPDGGFRAYAVVVGSFMTNGLVFGVINSYSVLFPIVEGYAQSQNLPNASSRASLVGSLAMGATFFMSPLSGVLAGILGLRFTAVLGGGIAATGMFLSSFVVDNVSALYFTYGLMYGIGASLAYIPSLAILGHYFKVHLGKVNGLVTIGSSIFTVIMPEIMKHMIVKYGLVWLFRLLAAFTLGMAFCGLLFKPIPFVTMEKPNKKKGFKAFLKTIINVQIWKIRKYAIWALSMPIALFGYFVPYVLISKFIEVNFPHSNDILPLQCIAVTSGLGRLIFGFLADRPGIDRIFLQQISFYAIGTLTIILPFMNVFGFVVAISLGMGLFDGAFISLIGPIAFQLCGGAYAAQAIGCMLGLAATPLSVGPPIAAYLFEIHQSYTLPFALAGISPIVGATLMFAVHYKGSSSNRDSSISNGIPAQPNAISIERSPSGSLLRKEEVYDQSTL